MQDIGSEFDWAEQTGTGAGCVGSEVLTYDFRSREAHEVQAFLTKVYAENKFKSTGAKRRVRTRIRTSTCSGIALCNVSHASPFSFESTAFRDSFLILSCKNGQGTVRIDDKTVPVFSKRSIPISAMGIAGISGEPALAHFSVHIRAEDVYSLCAQWTGSPLAQPLVFDLTPFAPQLAIYWQRIINAMDALMEMESPPKIALVSLREQAIALLLGSHPHNHSRFFRGHRTSSAQEVREAMRLMEDQADLPITVADIAGSLGCAIPSLHKGFLEFERTTPRAFLFETRLKRVRDALLADVPEVSTVAAAYRYGFADYERFSTIYLQRYGESPDDTFLRHNRACDRENNLELVAHGPNLPETTAKMLREHISGHMGSRLSVRSLALRVGMSVQNFIVAFSKTFGTTPAQYVIQERLRRARWLLSNTRQSVAIVAAETGFASQSHLTTTLKQHEGMTPTQYRRSFFK